MADHSRPNLTGGRNVRGLQGTERYPWITTNPGSQFRPLMRKVKDLNQRKIKFIKKTFGHSKIGKSNHWQIKSLENTVFRKLFLWQF